MKHDSRFQKLYVVSDLRLRLNRAFLAIHSSIETLLSLLIKVYLWIFPRPIFPIDDLTRSSAVVADFFALQLIYTAVDFLINLSSLTKLGLTNYATYICVLILLRLLTMSGRLKLVFSLYILSVIVFYLVVTENTRYFEHMQASNMILLVAYSTLVVGARFGFLTLLASLILFYFLRLASEYGYLLPISKRMDYAVGFRREWMTISTNLVEAYIFCLLVKHHVFSQLSFSLAREKLFSRRAVEARELADKANAEKSRFLAASSHDLRQPVSTLNLNFESYVVAHPECKTDGAIQDMARSIESMNKLLDGVLTVSKLQAHTVTPSISSVSINSVLQRCFAANSAAARLKKLQLRLRSTDLYCDTDADILYRAVNNLVNNAVKYTDKGGIIMGVRRRFGGVAIFVMGSGIGIAPESREVIFDEFMMLSDPSRKSDGSGLGLSIVKRSADLLGMKVHTESEVGVGSTFYLQLPAVRRQVAQPSVAPLDQTSNISDYSDLRGLVVAVIDDVLPVRKSICRSLQTHGMQTLDAGSWGEMLPLLKQATPAVLITDYQLDLDASGYAVVLEARKVISERLPCLIITGNTSTELVRELASLKVETLFKPLSTETLLAAIRTQLAKQ